MVGDIRFHAWDGEKEVIFILHVNERRVKLIQKASDSDIDGV